MAIERRILFLVETYVVRQGDDDRDSRELHDEILFMGVLGALLFDPQSLSLNRQVGGSFNDTQRSLGGERLRLCRAFSLSVC